MTKARIWFLAVTAALGGFLFGFDTIVINGAEQDIQALWNLSGTVHGWVVSSALWGTVLGSLCGGGVSDRWGRRRTLFAVGVLFFVSAVWSACATGPWTLIAARFIGGLGVGVSTIARGARLPHRRRGGSDVGDLRLLRGDDGLPLPLGAVVRPGDEGDESGVAICVHLRTCVPASFILY